MPATVVTRRGFGQLPCPCCGADSAVRVTLDELDVFACGECDEEFSPEDVRRFIGRWTAVLAWIDTAPEYTPE